MDPEVVANVSNSTEEITYSVNFYERLFLELFTIIGLVSVIANVFIIFVIIKFKKLREDVTNIILAHLCFLQAIYLVSTPLTLRVISTLFIVNHHVRVALYCVFYENEVVLTVAVCLFFFLLVCDWYLKTYSEAKYVKFTHVYKFFVAGVYICTIFLSVVVTMLCYKGLMLIASFLVMFVTYAVLIIFLIVMNIVHAVKKKRLQDSKPHVGLVITNMFFVFWIPIILLLLAMLIGHFHIPELFIVSFTIGFSSPVFNFLYLFNFVDSFNVFFKKVFKCQCNEYGNELLDEQAVSYSDVNGVKIDRNV